MPRRSRPRLRPPGAQDSRLPPVGPVPLSTRTRTAAEGADPRPEGQALSIKCSLYELPLGSNQRHASTEAVAIRRALMSFA